MKCVNTSTTHVVKLVVPPVIDFELFNFLKTVATVIILEKSIYFKNCKRQNDTFFIPNFMKRLKM